MTDLKLISQIKECKTITWKETNRFPSICILKHQHIHGIGKEIMVIGNDSKKIG